MTCDPKLSQPLCALVLLGDHSVNVESLIMTPSNRKDRSSRIKQHGLCGHHSLFPKQSTLRVGYHGYTMGVNTGCLFYHCLEYGSCYRMCRQRQDFIHRAAMLKDMIKETPSLLWVSFIT